MDVFDQLFVPGERLKPVELGERFVVSIRVMREALALLAAQHLVRNEGAASILLDPVVTDATSGETANVNQVSRE